MCKCNATHLRTRDPIKTYESFQMGFLYETLPQVRQNYQALNFDPSMCLFLFRKRFAVSHLKGLIALVVMIPLVGKGMVVFL